MPEIGGIAPDLARIWRLNRIIKRPLSAKTCMKGSVQPDGSIRLENADFLANAFLFLGGSLGRSSEPGISQAPTKHCNIALKECTKHKAQTLRKESWLCFLLSHASSKQLRLLSKSISPAKYSVLGE